MSTRTRRLAGRLAPLALAAAVIPTLVTPVHADPAGAAAAQAAALTARLGALQTNAEVAGQRYDAVESQLATAVTDSLLAQRRLAAARAAASDGRSALDDQARALYMSGGQVTLLATVLDAGSVDDALARIADVRSLESATRRQQHDSAAAVVAAAHAAATLAALAHRVTTLQRQAAAAAGQAQELVAQAQALLAAANARVQLLVAEQQAAAAAAAAAQFTAALAAAGNTGTLTPPTTAAAVAIAAARSKLGDPYLWGGTGPGAFDCSGLVQWAYAQAGIALPRVAAAQYGAGPHVPLAALAPGDLLFWATDITNPATIHHVGMYLGNGLMIDAPHTGSVVRIEPVYFDGYIGATRPS